MSLKPIISSTLKSMEIQCISSREKSAVRNRVKITRQAFMSSCLQPNAGACVHTYTHTYQLAMVP